MSMVVVNGLEHAGTPVWSFKSLYVMEALIHSTRVVCLCVWCWYISQQHNMPFIHATAQIFTWELPSSSTDWAAPLVQLRGTYIYFA